MSQLSHLRILIVDDSAILRKVVMGILKEEGIENNQVTEAVDGGEGVQQALSHPFHLILMDWNMPNMLGIDAVKTIRKAGNATPILMVTTEGERANVIAAIQAGANNYLVKPFTGKDLRDKLSQMLPEFK